MRPIVAYIRVSTQKQGASRLGLEAQRDAIIRFADAERYQVTETFSEIETGKGAHLTAGRNWPLPSRRPGRPSVRSLSPSSIGSAVKQFAPEPPRRPARDGCR
jgi:hypothetical protein